MVELPHLWRRSMFSGRGSTKFETASIALSDALRSLRFVLRLALREARSLDSKASERVSPFGACESFILHLFPALVSGFNAVATALILRGEAFSSTLRVAPRNFLPLSSRATTFEEEMG